MSLGDLIAQARPPERPTRSPDLPTGMTPSMEFDGSGGTITTGPIAKAPDAAIWRHLIADWGLDANVTEVVDGSITVKGWDSPVKGTTTGETIRLLSYTAKIRARATDVADRADIAKLCKQASRLKPPRIIAPATADCERAMVVCMADWQLGKGEGDGSEGTVNRITEAGARLIKRLAELRKAGRGVDVVYLVGLGDLVEGCSGHYASQTFTVDLTRREQLMVARRLIKQLVDFVVGAGYRVVLSAVAGNHGENRNGAGKAYTTPEDNDDLAVVEQVGEILAANPDRYDAVTVFLPSELSMTLDVCGVAVGFAHGHQTRGGATAAAKVANWWRDQIVGGGPTADAMILVTGHYHHLVLSESSGRTHMQCPAMDPGSSWWTEMSGQSSPAGLLTFCVGGNYGERGWGDLAVL